MNRQVYLEAAVLVDSDGQPLFVPAPGASRRQCAC